ncbi:MAG: hypothetical protein Q9220_000574 [cf. Caloplaca sp. 1 TL-2023]
MASSATEPGALAHASIKEADPIEGSSQNDSTTADEQLKQKGAASTTSISQVKNSNESGSSDTESGHMELLNRKTQPFQLLDLPLDVLEDIVKELTNTNDLTSLALTCSALHQLAVSQIYCRFDIVWPQPLSAADPRQGVDALTPQYTRTFSLGNGPPESTKDYLINGETGKMLGTLVALAISRMPNLETFIWDMPTGVLRDCWLALSAPDEADVRNRHKLEKLWIRFHDNRQVIVSSDSPLATIPDSINIDFSSDAHNNKDLSRMPSPDVLEWSYRHIEQPSFSILPAMRSLNVLNIDELAYLSEMSVLLERSHESLRELRIGVAYYVSQVGFASTRKLVKANPSALSLFTGALDLLMSKLCNKESERHGVPSTMQAQPGEDSMLSSSNSGPVSLDASVVPCDLKDTLVHDKKNQTDTGKLTTRIASKVERPDDPAGLLDELGLRSDQCDPSSSERLLQSPLQDRMKEHTSAGKDPANNEHDVSFRPNLEANVRHQRQLRLQVLELERVHLSAFVMKAMIDWPVITTLTLLHCDSHEQFWKMLRKAYTPRQKSQAAPNDSQCSASAQDYRLGLRRLHTNAVSAALVSFLKETLRPNSLEWLFLQDGAEVVLDRSGRRGTYESTVTLEAICRGPLKRHRLSLTKLMIDSDGQPATSRHGHSRRSTLSKWKLDRDTLSYVTSGKMSVLREIAFSLDYKDWHFFLQRIPHVPHPKDLAMQIMDIVALRPNVELCYVAIAWKCFEILQGASRDDDGDSATVPVTRGPGSLSSSELTDDEEDEEDADDDVNQNNTHPAVIDGHDSDSESLDEITEEPDSESEDHNGSPHQPYWRLKDILFYEEKVSIFKARHGKL